MCNKIQRVTYPRTYKKCALHSSAWSVHCAMEMCNQLVNHVAYQHITIKPQ